MSDDLKKSNSEENEYVCMYAWYMIERYMEESLSLHTCLLKH